MTTGARFERVQSLLLDALEQQPSARDAWLRAAAAGDDALLADVTSLLAAHQAGGLLGEMPESPRLFGLPSDHIGPYRILRPLGRGGMGAVYLAERTAGDVRQVVALKLLRADYGPPQLVERFIAERRILARLEHPGIARLIDAGQAADGQPYFAMEFVEGTDLISWARQRRLTVADRLRLMLAVCSAVEYAHRQLVVHRDLKPSNIQVGEDGRPKLLDFGIARLLEVEAGGPAATRTLQWLTPDYASPEQVRGEPAGTASDVYSLGVLLYELLADRRPFELDQLSPAAMEHVICHLAPPRPSERAESPRLRSLLRGDLDTIVLKALAKEPERRYDSVQALDEDLRRYLDRKPVRARPATVAYRTTMFVRRHSTAVAGAALVLASLLGGLVAVRRQAREAELARDRAEESARASQEVSAFLVDMFRSSQPGDAGGDTAVARAILRRGVERAEALAAQPVAQARILDALGMVFLGLGQHDRAHELVRRGLELRRAGLGPRHPDVAESLRHLARVDRFRSRYREAEAALNEALSIQEAPGAGHGGAIATLDDMAMLLPYLGRENEAESFRRIALQLTREYFPHDTIQLTDRTILLAQVLRRLGEYAEAARLMREAIALRLQSVGPGDRRTGETLIQFADVMREAAGGEVEAESLYREGVRITRSAFGDTRQTMVHGLGNLAEMLSDQGRHAEAERLLREALDLRRRFEGSDNPSVGGSLQALGLVVGRQGRSAEADQLLRDAFAIWRRTIGMENAFYAGGLESLAKLREAQGRLRDAESTWGQAIALRSRLLSPGHVVIGVNLSELAPVLARQGRLAEAESTLLRSVAILRAHERETHWNVRRARRRLVEVYRAMGREDDARRQEALIQDQAATAR